MSQNDPLSPDGDPFGPPEISTLVSCLHCGETYDSYRIEWRIERDGDGRPHGFWCCPIAGCGGMGFGFDIFPVDPEYRNENGELMWCDDEEGDEEEDEFEEGELEADVDAPRLGGDQEDELPW